jgi:biopolymer transport protein ExbD
MSKFNFSGDAGTGARFGSQASAHDAPDINLIAFIDVLLVLVMFLMLTTVYANKAGLTVELPTAKTNIPSSTTPTIVVRIDAAGASAINGKRFTGGTAAMGAALLTAAGEQAQVRVVIAADAKAPHQAVIDVMSAARLAGLNQLQFAIRAQDNAP